MNSRTMSKWLTRLLAQGRNAVPSFADGAFILTVDGETYKTEDALAVEFGAETVASPVLLNRKLAVSGIEALQAGKKLSAGEQGAIDVLLRMLTKTRKPRTPKSK